MLDANHLDEKYTAVTFGSPGFDGLDAPTDDPRIVNIVVEEDPIVLTPVIETIFNAFLPLLLGPVGFLLDVPASPQAGDTYTVTDSDGRSGVPFKTLLKDPFALHDVELYLQVAKILDSLEVPLASLSSNGLVDGAEIPLDITYVSDRIWEVTLPSGQINPPNPLHAFVASGVFDIVS